MNRSVSDFIRVFVLLVATGTGLYVLDTSNIVVIQALLIGVFLVGGSHLTRRVLFHRLDLQQIAMTAIHERNYAAAAVFVAICLFLIAVMFLSLLILR